MRLPASEKLEIIGLVEQSRLPARRTLQMLGIKPSTFYRSYDRFRSGGPEALEDKAPKPDRTSAAVPVRAPWQARCLEHSQNDRSLFFVTVVSTDSINQQKRAVPGKPI